MYKRGHELNIQTKNAICSNDKSTRRLLLHMRGKCNFPIEDIKKTILFIAEGLLAFDPLRRSSSGNSLDLTFFCGN